MPPSSSSVPVRPDDAAAATHATSSNTFHVLNSSSGTGGHASTGGVYARPPQAAALHSPPVHAIASYGYPGTGIAIPAHTPSGALGPQMLQQLMILAGWGPTRPPWFQGYAYMSPRGQPLLPSLSPSVRSIRPPSFTSGPPGANGSSVGTRGAVAVVESSSDVGGGSASRRKPPNLTPLQITTVAATGIGPASRKKTPAASGNADGAVQHLPPVLAMSMTAGAQGKVAVATNDRVQKGVDKDNNQPASSKKLRQRTTDKQPDMDDQSNNLKIIPISPPPPSNSRKRKQSASTAASTSGNRCNVVARRSSSAVVAPPAKKHTVLTWLIDAGYLSDKEKVFHVPGGGNVGKVVSGAVSR